MLGIALLFALFVGRGPNSFSLRPSIRTGVSILWMCIYAVLMNFGLEIHDSKVGEGGGTYNTTLRSNQVPALNFSIIVSELFVCASSRQFLMSSPFYLEVEEKA